MKRKKTDFQILGLSLGDFSEKLGTHSQKSKIFLASYHRYSFFDLISKKEMSTNFKSSQIF